MKNLIKNLVRLELNRLKPSLFGWATIACFVCGISLQASAQNSDLLALQKQPDTSWITFKNDTGAFSIKLPTRPFSMKKELPAKIGKDSVKFLLNLYVSVDSATELSYIVRYNDYPAGTFLSDKSKVLAGFEKDFAGKGKIVGEAKQVATDGFEGREFNFALDQGFNGIVRFFIRGNRVYVLLRQVHAFTSGDKISALFFNSFHLLPFTDPTCYNYQPAGRHFTIQLPASPVVKSDSSLHYSSYLVGEQLYSSTNPNSGDLFTVESSRISPYYRADNIDTAFKKTIRLLTGYRDSLVKLDTISLRGIKGREFVTVDRFSRIKMRSRIFIDGENFFFLSGRTDESEIFGKTSDIFFSSLTLTQPSRSFDFPSSKAQKICSDLSSADTLVAKRAKGAISYYDFKRDELPFIYTALGKTYPDDTTENGIRVSLIQKLRHENTDSTLYILTSLYPFLVGKDEIKAAILNVLPSLNRKKSYNEYLRLLTTDSTLKTKYPYQITRALFDSIKFAQQNFRSIIPLIKHHSFRPYLLLIAIRVAEVDSPAYKKAVESSYEALMAYALADMKEYLKTKDSVSNDYSGSVYSYMRLMAQIRNADLTKKLTDEYLQAAPHGVHASDAIVARIANGLPNDEALLKFYMDSLDTRYDLMKAYYQQKRVDKIPEVYRHQEVFAKLCLYKFISTNDGDDDNTGTPTGMELLGSLNHGGNIYYAFKFSLVGDEDKKTMIGIAGPYKPGSTMLKFDKYYAYTSFEAINPDWRKQALLMIKPLNKADR